MGNPKPSAVELKKLKEALHDLKALQSQIASGGNPESFDRLPQIMSIQQDVKGLMGNSASTLQHYYHSRASSVHDAITRARTGVGTLVTLLEATISNYDNNENTHKDAADKTATGGPDQKG